MANQTKTAAEIQALAEEAYIYGLPVKEANWLPAPDGPFYMLLRLYWPEQSFLDGSWVLPGLSKA